MADSDLSGGHWANLGEVQKLTQTQLLKGVIDEAPKRGGLLSVLPLKQQGGISIKWNRSNARRVAQRMAVGGQIPWTDNVTYTQIETKLKIFADQSPLDNYVSGVYGTFQDYEAQQLLELRTGIVETIEDALIYDDQDYTTLQMQGLHHWAVDQTGTNGDLDEGDGALSFHNMRLQLDYMKYGTDFILMPYELQRRVSEYYQEAHFDSGGTNTLNQIGSFIWQPGQQGGRIGLWAGVPIRASDYLVQETAGTGAGSDARAKNTSGARFSMFMVKMGQPGMINDPGVNLGFGGQRNLRGEVFRTVVFNDLEDYDASGVRLVSYMGAMLGSSLGLGRIYDITDAVPTA